MTYSELSKEDAWILVPRHERAIITKLGKACKRLADKTITRSIFVGIQTSADHIFHLKRIRKGRYEYQQPKPKGARVRPPPQEVSLEDNIMHPIVSGEEVQRYQTPITDTYILFPYQKTGSGMELISCRDMKTGFPLAWAYLGRFEKELRCRERSKMDKDDIWWGYNYPKNLAKQEIPKILVPRLSRHFAAINDADGRFYIDNVDVGGIDIANGMDGDFLTGVLNSAVINFVWKRIAKPFQNGYLSANKQFIAPLPIPVVKPRIAHKIASLSKTLTRLHTDRRDTLTRLDKRFRGCELEEKSVEWLWPAKVRNLDKWKSDAPAGLKTYQKMAWAKEQQAKEIELAIDALKDRLRPYAQLEVELNNGELRVLDDGTVVLDGVFVGNDQGMQTLIDWRNSLRLNPISEVPDAKSLANKLRTVRVTENTAVAKQLSDLDAELLRLDKEIDIHETDLNKLASAAYALTPAELKIILQ